MNIVAIVQARVNSKRFPNKVMQKIKKKTLIAILLERLSRSNLINQIVVASPSDKKNLAFLNYIKKLGYKTFYDNKIKEYDLLNRYYNCAKKYKANVIVRITSDCPLVDPFLIDKMLKHFKKNKIDYLSNVDSATFPDGFDVEILKFEKLKKIKMFAKNNEDLEHFTQLFRNSSKVRKNNFKLLKDYSKLRLTVDYPKDLVVVRKVFDHFHPKIIFSYNDVLKLYKKKPKIFKFNSSIPRNEKTDLSKSQALWKKAKKIIPDGNMLLSKRPEIFLPNRWPTYFTRAKGCHIWDLNGQKYTDMSLMGVGTNILGYCNALVDRSVSNAIKNSNMSTLNCPEEVYLAEKLIELHPWAKMVKFARTGGEANAIAIRIARAASGKDKVAVCGYHGWHDWYLAANLAEKKALNDHLRPNIKIKGVPKNLKNTIFPFEYNNIDQLKKILKNHEIGCIKMEVVRNYMPKKNFLKEVKKICKQKNIVLIFDECTTGFRQSFGGLHKFYKVNPDIAIFGKALGNGYAISAIVGTEEVMLEAQNTFISSTFWTERIGPSAALKTLEVMEKCKSWETITKIGKKIVGNWKRIARENNIKIDIQGIPALASFEINSKNWMAYKTFLTQEMLKKGILASSRIYACTEHKSRILDNYFYNLEKIFKKISDFENGEDVNKYLEADIAKNMFGRYN